MKTDCAVTVFCLCVASPVAAERAEERYWPAWRGPLATGVAPQADPPIEWGENENIAFKVEIPGLGISSPVVWGDRVYVTTAVKTERTGQPPDRGRLLEQVPEGRRDTARTSRRGGGGSDTDESNNHIFQFVVLAFDRNQGDIVWHHVCREQVPHETGHSQNTRASGSPVTDGETLIVHFGSYGTYAFDLKGNQLWSTDLGDMLTRRGFGEGASPALFGDTVVIPWDHEGDSFIVALDKNTGKELWRQSRDEPTNWSTPLIVGRAGSTQVILNATNRIRGYDLDTGREVWQCGGMTTNAIPTPVADDKLVYVMSGFRSSAVRAIPYSQAPGDITASATVAWTYDQDTPYVPSPLLYEGRLYFTKGNAPILTCLQAPAGKKLYGPQRLEGIREIYASPVAAAGRIYITGRDGETVVLKAGDELRVLATNKLDDAFDATPALVGESLYFRGRKHLYRIAKL